MKVVFDTSVLVAGSVIGHIHEARALAWFEGARDERLEGYATCHAFAEAWATLTALPIEPRVAPANATRLVQSLSAIIEPLPLLPKDYDRAMERCSDRGLRSGSVYDALHLVAAERAGADIMLTFNTRDFSRLASHESSVRVLAPPDPPGFAGIS